MNSQKAMIVLNTLTKKAKSLYSKKITKKELMIYSPSFLLILAGISAVFSMTLLKLCLSCFLIASGILVFKITKKISTTKNDLLAMIGQIDGQLLIHKHKMDLDKEEEFIDSLNESKKVIFH